MMMMIESARDVNETLRSETETRPRRLASSSLRDETETAIPCRFSRDRDRDRDVQSGVRDETETETLIGRDRDIFRDLGTLSIFGLHKSFFSKLTISSRTVKSAVQSRVFV